MTETNHTLIHGVRPPVLTLVGAGPGDPDLLTIKAFKAIQAADVVLYDALVSDEILDLIPKGTLALSVGKRAGAHSIPQEDINRIIVEKAFQHGHVVRLKGGDPFVFGRGYEEMIFAAEAGIRVNVIPGISSSIGVPATSHIPITARGYSESFFVVTGTTQAGTLSDDLALAAQSTATVVVLMGLGHLEAIMEIFVAHGKSDLPVAIIENGTTHQSRTHTGTVRTIATTVRDANVKPPAVIVIGRVVDCAENLRRVSQQHIARVS